MRKHIKSTLCLVLALLCLTAALSACGKEEPIKVPEISAAPQQSPDAEPQESAEPSNEPLPETASPADDATLDGKTLCEDGILGDYHIEVVGAEGFKNSDGDPSVRFYYDFTNNSMTTTSAGMALSFEAYQDGRELDTTYASYDEDAAEYGNSSLGVRPGVTIRCVAEYALDSETGSVRFEAYDWQWEADENYRVMASYGLSSLPGAPKTAWAVEPVAEPAWTDGYAWEGEMGDVTVSIGDAEGIANWNNEPSMRVYITLTNNGEKPITAWDVVYVRAYQDGIQLDGSFADEEVEEDDNDDREIRTGETLTFSEIFALRSDSPIEVEATDWAGDGAFGGVYYPQS